MRYAGSMMRFPIQEILREEDCYEWLLHTLHPEGLHCPQGHKLPEDQAPHDRKRAPLVKYRCRQCGAVYNILSGTVWSGTHLDCCVIVLLLRGFAKGVTSQALADELELSYKTVLTWRHRIQAEAVTKSETKVIDDKEAEGDELFQNAGEKGEKHEDPDDPPRQRSNPRRGRGTYEQDRPVVTGVVGRESGELHLSVAADTQNDTMVPLYEQQVDEETTFFTDEAHHFDPIEETVAQHHTVAHGQDEYARDPDDDGHHEVHVNTMEGIWVGCRNFIRPFRGVHKKYLPQYVAMFEWTHNLKEVTDEFIRHLCWPDFTLDYT